MKRNWKNFFSKTKWFVFHKRKRSAFMQPVLFGPGILDRKVGFDHRIRYFGDIFDTVLVAHTEREKLRTKIGASLKKHPHSMLRLMERAYAQKTTYQKTWMRIAKQDFSGITRVELIKIFKEYIGQLMAWGPYISMPVFYEDIMENVVREGLYKKFGEQAEQYMHIVLDPVKSGSVLEEEIEMLKLATKKTLSDNDIKNHAEKFSWMNNVGFLHTFYSENYYKKRLNKYKRNNPKSALKKILESRKQHARQFSSLVKKLRGDMYLQSLVKTVNEAVYFRSFRTEMFYESAKYYTNAFQAVAKILKIKNYKDVLWFYPDELIDVLENPKILNLNLILGRKKNGFAFLSDFDGKYWKWDGKDAGKIYEWFLQSQMKNVNLNLNRLTGAGAYPGIVRGKVLVIHSFEELKRIKKGNILVTHSTNVNFVPSLKKVSAIVTEEGGILSHAAIISREMKIPTVIGTKIATKVFKDGDMVEVDADKGAVKKIF